MVEPPNPAVTAPTPIPISPRLRNILVLAALALLVLLLWAAPGVLTVLLGGATLALGLSLHAVGAAAIAASSPPPGTAPKYTSHYRSRRWGTCPRG